MNLQQRHTVARAVEAFQANNGNVKPLEVQEEPPSSHVNGHGDITPLQDAKITRDVVSHFLNNT